MQIASGFIDWGTILLTLNVRNGFEILPSGRIRPFNFQNTRNKKLDMAICYDKLELSFPFHSSLCKNQISLERKCKAHFEFPWIQGETKLEILEI